MADKACMLLLSYASSVTCRTCTERNKIRAEFLHDSSYLLPLIYRKTITFNTITVRFEVLTAVAMNVAIFCDIVRM
jgi:hypothetical protein